MTRPTTVPTASRAVPDAPTVVEVRESAIAALRPEEGRDPAEEWLLYRLEHLLDPDVIDVERGPTPHNARRVHVRFGSHQAARTFRALMVQRGIPPRFFKILEAGTRQPTAARAA